MLVPIIIAGALVWLWYASDKTPLELETEAQARQWRQRQLGIEFAPRVAELDPESLRVIQGMIAAHPQLAGLLEALPAVVPVQAREVVTATVGCFDPIWDPEMPAPTHHAPIQCGEFRTVRVGNRIENRSGYPGESCGGDQLALVVRNMDKARHGGPPGAQLHSLVCSDGVWVDTGVLCWEEGIRAMNPWGQVIARCRDGVWGSP